MLVSSGLLPEAVRTIDNNGIEIQLIIDVEMPKHTCKDSEILKTQ